MALGNFIIGPGGAVLGRKNGAKNLVLTSLQRDSFT